MSQLSTKLEWELANPKWAAILNPFLALPILNGNLIRDINLVTNVPKSINHLLQRKPIGWIVTDINNNSFIYRTKPFNDSTLTLTTNSTSTISIWVF